MTHNPIIALDSFTIIETQKEFLIALDLKNALYKIDVLTGNILNYK